MALEKFNTPRCEFKYPFTVTKDIPQDPTIKPKFKITGVFDPKNNPKHAEFLNKISGMVTKAEIYKDKHPIKKDFEKQDDDSYVESGKVAITFKTDFKPTIFDAKLNPIIREENYIANGSEGIINYSTYEYKPGLISMILNSAQVIRLIEWEGTTDPTALGFKEEEGHDEFKPSQEVENKIEEFKNENQDEGIPIEEEPQDDDPEAPLPF